MIENRSCECPICKIEQELALTLNQPTSQDRFRLLATSFPTLANFPSAFELVAHLHGQAVSANQVPSADEILGALVRAAVSGSDQEFFQRLLILVFIPTMHRTYRETCVYFPTLLREDVAQQVLTTFLETTRSPTMASQNGHLPVAVARTVRKAAFHWAIKETRTPVAHQWCEDAVADRAQSAADGHFESSVILQEFLDGCCRRGVLSTSEHQLLAKMKLEGFEAKEVAGLGEKMSAIAIHHRLHRIMRRLRRTALG